MVKYKQSCVSLIVLAALMGVSQSGVAGKTPPGTPRANEEEDKKTIHRNPTNLKNLEAVPQDVVASLILPHLDARSALSLELTSYGLCQAVNKSHLWVATKEKLRSGDLINVEGVLIGHLTNPFCEKHRAHVKSTDDKTRRMVLFCSFRLAKLAGIVDKDCKELVTFVESLGEACEDVTTVMSTFVHPDLSVNGMGVIARVVHGAGPKRREICEAAIYLIETLKARSEPFYDKMAIVETMSQVDGDYMNLVTVSLENGLITQGVLKDRHLGRVLKTVHALGENRDKICPLAKEFVNEKDIAYKVEELLKNINTIVKSNADTDAILSLVRTVNSQLCEGPSEAFAYVSIVWKLGEDRSEIVRLAIENAPITNAYRKDLTVAGALGGYRDLGKQRGAICALVNGYTAEDICPYYLPELLEFVRDEGIEGADALYKAAKPLAIHGMPETPWRKRLLKAIQDLGEEREVIIQLAVNNNLITKDIYQFDTDVIKILNAIKDIGATREEVCDSVKVFIRPEMDVYNVVKFIEMIGGIKTDRDSICTLTNRIIQTRGLHQIMPLMIQKSQWSRNYPYLDYCRELICDVESLGDSREDIVMTAIPLFTQDLDPIEIRGFLQKTKNLGDDRSIISKLLKTNGLLTSSNNNYKNEGLFQTLEAVKNIKKDREVLCSVAKDFVWEQMRAGELGGYFDILNEVGEDCAAINALAISHNLLPLRPKDDARRTTFSFNSGRECDYLFLVRKALFAVKTLGGKRDLILSLLKDYLTEEAWVPLFRDFSTSRDQENARFLESLGELGPIPDCETRIRVAQDCRLIKPKMKWKEVAGVLKYLGTLPLASLQDHCSKATEQITDEMVLADEIIDRVQTVNPIILHAPGARFVVKEVKPEFNIERALDRLGEIKDVVCEEVKDIVFKDTDDLKLYIKEMRSVHELGRHPRSVCAEAKRFIPYCKNANGFGDFLDQTRNTLLYFPEVYELSHDLIQKYSKGKKTTLDSVAKLIHVIKRLGHNRDRVCNIAKSLTYNWGVEDLNNLLEMIEEVCANTGDQCEAIFSWADQIITPDTDKQGFIYTINDVFGVIDDPHRLNVMYLTQKFRVLQEKYPICFLLCYEDKRAEEVVNRLKGLENCEEVLLQAEDKMTDGMTIDDLLNLLVKG